MGKVSKNTLYKIEIDGVVRYWGITNDLKRRQNQHNRGIRTGIKKELYDWLRENSIDEVELIPHAEYKNRVEAKRNEMYLILTDWLGPKLLKQKIPSIMD